LDQQFTKAGEEYKKKLLARREAERSARDGAERHGLEPAHRGQQVKRPAAKDEGALEAAEEDQAKLAAEQAKILQDEEGKVRQQEELADHAVQLAPELRLPQYYPNNNLKKCSTSGNLPDKTIVTVKIGGKQF